MGKLISLDQVRAAKNNSLIVRSLLVEFAVDEITTKLNKDILQRSHLNSWQYTVSSLDEVAVSALQAITATDLIGEEYDIHFENQGRETVLVVSARLKQAS